MALSGETSNPRDKPMIRLKSSDHEVFTIKKEVAMKSKTIAAWFDDGEDYPDELIPVPEVKSSTLQMVIEYCELHVDDTDEDKDFVLTRSDPFRAQLRRVDWKVLFDLIQAANYLNVEGLLHLGCQIAADMMKDKSAEEMREILHIKNDYTPGEEAAVRKKISVGF